MVAKHPQSLPGIYRITRISDGKVYIGQARKVSQRCTMHRYSLNKGSHRNGPLQEAWSRSSPEDWTWDVVCEPIGGHDPEAMTFLEVEVLKNYPDNFNLMVPVQAYLGASESTRDKLSAYRNERWADPEYRERVKGSHKARHADPGYRERHGVAMRAFYETDESKTVRREGGKKASEAWKNRPEMREAERARRLKLWADPEYRACVLASRAEARKDPEKEARRVAGLKRAWDACTPQERQARVSAATANQRSAEGRAKASARGKAAWEKRRRQKG